MRTTEVIRTEKRKLRLSPNKFQAIRGYFTIHIQLDGICVFYKFIRWIVRQKEVYIPFCKKEKNIPVIAYEICLALLVYHKKLKL